MAFALATVRDPQSAEHVKALALREKSPERALPMWQSALRLDPENITLLGHEALALLDVGRPADVVSRLVRVLPDSPRHPHLLNLFGVALFELGHAQDALRVFEHLRSVDAEYPPLEKSIENARRHLSKSKPASAQARAAIDRIIAEAARRPRPRLAVCMIAKNEAEFIVGAVDSVRGFADEIIVVDTGSTDATVELARGAGAQVEHFAWIGDFSAARNASLAYATADWVLCLDADERLTRESRSSIRAVMEEGGDPHRVVCVRILNYTRDGKFMNDGFSGRLFRNVPTMRFHGRVHEEVGGDRTDVSTDYRLDISFDHYGADPAVMREKAKDQRNIELLESRLRDKPDDLLTWFYLGSQHGMAGRVEAATRAFERVVDLFERNPSAHSLVVRNLPVPYSYVGAVRGLTDQGKTARAIDLGQRGLARYADNPDLWYHTAFAYIAQHEYVHARRYLERCLETNLSGFGLIAMSNKSIKAWRAEKFLGDIDFEEGKRAEAYARYSGVFERMPENPDETVPIAARLVELACELEDFERVGHWAQTYLKLRPSEYHVGLQVAMLLKQQRGLQATYDYLVSTWTAVEALHDKVEWTLAVGEVALDAGAREEALTWYERALGLGHRDPGFLAHVARLLVEVGATDAARELLALARTQLARTE
jgi:glycosyltransferase involved in cell wall biosynthesis